MVYVTFTLRDADSSRSVFLKAAATMRELDPHPWLRMIGLENTTQALCSDPCISQTLGPSPMTVSQHSESSRLFHISSSFPSAPSSPEMLHPLGCSPDSSILSHPTGSNEHSVCVSQWSPSVCIQLRTWAIFLPSSVCQVYQLSWGLGRI